MKSRKMGEDLPNRNGNVSSLSEHIELVAEEWERRRDDLEIGDLTSLVPDSGEASRSAVLVELIKIDQEYRWGRGQKPLVEDYLTFFPAAAPEETILELVVAECLTRGSLDTLPTESEIRSRFAGLAERVDLKEIEARLAAEDLPALGLLDEAGNGATPRSSLECTAFRKTPPSPLRPGEKFGANDRYEILGELGKGGMATVYLALDTLLQRRLALKVLHAAISKGDEGMKRWLGEAQMSARLRDHPNLCQVYDAGQWEGLSYIALEWIEGESLDKKLARGETSPRESARLTCKLARVLEEVHAAGVVHRDLKPSNVMINHKGEPVLLDFGISTLLEPATATPPEADSRATEETVSVRFTGYSQLPGTLPWMAPEQLLGKVDSQSDIYSLGVMLFQMLTGKLPHTSSTLATQTELQRLMNDILHADPGGPELQNPEVDPTLAKICRKAMAKNPKSRYSSAGLMATALESYLEGQPRAASGGRRRFVTRRTLVALAFVAIFVAAAVVVVMKTGEGTVVVVVDEPGTEVLVNGSRVEIKDGKATSVVQVGESEVEVVRAGHEPKKESVFIHWRGERVVLRRGGGWRFPARDAAGSNYQPRGSDVKTTTVLQVKHTLGIGDSRSLTGDIDGDGRTELVRTEGDQLYIYDHNLRIRTQETMPMHGVLTMLDDVDDDGVIDIGIAAREDDPPTACCFFYDANGNLKRVFERKVGFDGGISPVTVTSPGKVLVLGESGFSREPRCLVQYEYASGEVDWSYDFGFAGRGVSVADIDGDGKLEITLGWASTHNGHFVNGTSDQALYLTITDDGGTNLLTQKYPDPDPDTDKGAVYHVFTDLDQNGRCEILAVEQHGSDVYQGANQVHLYDLGGKKLHTYTYTGPAGEVWTWAIADLDGDGTENVIVGGYSVLTVLDDRLREVRSINEDGSVELAADLTGNGYAEIVTINRANLLRVYNCRLELVDSLQLRGKPTSRQVVADDIDSDGIIEMIVPSSVGSHVVSFRREQ